MYFNQLNTQITFIKTVITKDEHNIAHEPDMPVFTAFAEIRVQSLNQIATTLGTALENSLTFIIRLEQPTSITNDMKIQYNNQTYEIIQQLPDINNRLNQIVAKAVGS